MKDEELSRNQTSKAPDTTVEHEDAAQIAPTNTSESSNGPVDNAPSETTLTAPASPETNELKPDDLEMLLNDSALPQIPSTELSDAHADMPELPVSMELVPYEMADVPTIPETSIVMPELSVVMSEVPDVMPDGPIEMPDELPDEVNEESPEEPPEFAPMDSQELFGISSAIAEFPVITASELDNSAVSASMNASMNSSMNSSLNSSMRSSFNGSLSALAGVRKKKTNRKKKKARFPCPKCTAMCSRLDTLVRHMKYDCCVLAPRYACPYCNYRSKRTSDTYNHIRRKHKGEEVHCLEIEPIPQTD